MDSFKRLFGPVVSKNNQPKAPIKVTSHLTSNKSDDDKPSPSDDANDSTPFLGIQRQKINLKQHQQLFNAPPLKKQQAKFDDTDFEIKSGCVFSSSPPPKFSSFSTSPNPLSSDNVAIEENNNCQKSATDNNAGNNSIQKPINLIDSSCETNTFFGNNFNSQSVCNENHMDILVRLKRILERYDRMMLSVDSRIENLHNSLLKELIDSSSGDNPSC